MSASTYLLAAAALAAAAAAPRPLQLSEMINNTVCAIEEKYDVNPNRVPQRIKVLKCAQKTSQWCERNNIPSNDCCHHKHNDHVMECVEMMDTVAVYNTLSRQTETYSVPVGCACMISLSTSAPDTSATNTSAPDTSGRR